MTGNNVHASKHALNFLCFSDYEAEIRSLETELIKSRRELGALNLELRFISSLITN